MKKISTLFKKNPTDLGKVINEINTENQWVFNSEGIPTRKFNGAAAAIINCELYKRYDVKKGRQIPEGAIACQEPDEITGHHPHWVKCIRSKPEDKYFYEAYDCLKDKEDGTYELCGEKIQGNPEKISGQQLIKHGCEILEISDFSFGAIREYLSNPKNDIEGIVFHHKSDARMCKIRKKDFNIKRWLAS